MTPFTSHFLFTHLAERRLLLEMYSLILCPDQLHSSTQFLLPRMLVLFARGQSVWSVNLTTDLYLMTRLKCWEFFLMYLTANGLPPGGSGYSACT